ncbi:hypothetical protein DFH09DRAFT_1322593 [Mycena vulgaris]|nr:hypothetical protein DFH09DRAFT_1322593 [Mycena vulgaris]
MCAPKRLSSNHEGFSSESAAVDSISALSEIHLKYLREALAASIKAKQDEVAHLEHALTPQQLFNELTPFISNRADEILKRTQLPNLVTNAQGVLVLDGCLENSAAKSLASIVMEDCVVYAFRVISITEAAALKVELKFTKKKALQQQADNGKKRRLLATSRPSNLEKSQDVQTGPKAKASKGGKPQQKGKGKAK